MVIQHTSAVWGLLFCNRVFICCFQQEPPKIGELVLSQALLGETLHDPLSTQLGTFR